MLLELTEGIKIPIEPHPYTLNEALKMLERGNPIIVDAIEEGEPIKLTREFDKLLEKYKSMRKAGKLKRTKTTIIF